MKVVSGVADRHKIGVDKESGPLLTGGSVEGASDGKLEVVGNG